MEITITENRIKELVKDTMIEIMTEKKDIFYNLIIEAIEDIGIGNAIKEGRKGKFVDEKQIMNILEG